MVTRYAAALIAVEEGASWRADMIEAPRSGSYVLYSDFEALATRIDEIEGTIKKLAASLTSGAQASATLRDESLAHQARADEYREALAEGAEFLHLFTPAGTKAVDAFIAKWRK